MTVIEKPQIIPHLQKSLNYTAFDVKWVPCSARFVVLGQYSRGTGVMQVYEIDNGELKVTQETEKTHAFKCGTFGASNLNTRHFATGDFSGRLSLWDLDHTELPVYSVQAHDQIINCIDGAGGIGINCGAPEIATGSRDGSVKVWDVRQRDKPVVTIAPEKRDGDRDTWAVAFGNSFNDDERMLCSGYDNGDVKMFDLRNMNLLWETNIKNGVCAIEFDRGDIKMNKMVVTSLESTFYTFDLRTLNPEKGFANTVTKLSDNTTIWTVKHLPQNRDIFMTSGGNGSLNLYKYNYPSSRVHKNNKNEDEGVPGTVELLATAKVAEQPVSSLSWNYDKEGLCAFTSFDQHIRVGIVTKLNLY